MSERETLTAELAGRYEIEGELGQGGMATVYRARDVRHQRVVAIKVIRRELVGANGADRFLREIQIAAQLSHPHILPLYDSGTAKDQLFYGARIASTRVPISTAWPRWRTRCSLASRPSPAARRT